MNRPYPVEITPGAVAKLKEALVAENPQPKGIRIGVLGGGCSGYQYSMDFVTQEGEDDIVYDQWGVKIYVDPYSAALLEGTIVDYASSLIGGGFKFDNPNANRHCGCGSSFSMEKEEI